MLGFIALAAAVCCDAEAIGKRPYEMDWAGRHEEQPAPLVDFEDLSGWRVECTNAEATFERAREQQLWGKYVGKLTYRKSGRGVPEVRILAPAPIPIPSPFDAAHCWIYGNNWAYGVDPSTPRVTVAALFENSKGEELGVHLTSVRWKEWFLCHRRLTAEQLESVKNGAAFKGFSITNGRNKEDRVIYFDNAAAYKEAFAPLTFEPRPKRGVDMFPGQGGGANTGPGVLPFPTRPETICPENLCTDATTSVRQDGDTYVFRYSGSDGELVYRVRPATGRLDDIEAQWMGRGSRFRPCVGGGVVLADANNNPVVPEKSELIDAKLENGVLTTRWGMDGGATHADAALVYRLWGKSLVVDVIACGGVVAEVRYGRARELESPRLVTLPYYTYGQSVRPAIVVSGPENRPLFLAGHTDWTRSNASTVWAENEADTEGVAYNGGTRYTPKTDGKRNDCFERLFVTVSPRFEEVLPTIPNPVSPWKHVTGTHVWRAHGAGNRENDARFWRRVKRLGMSEIVVTDHETGWRDGGESFTFRTRTAPGKGGDEGQFKYARIMQDELGFVYGPYNNYTDFAPVNEFWSTDMVNRRADKQLQEAWARCYAPKPQRAVEYCARLAPIIQEKFRFSTAYCDVHTAVTPWSRVDYDYRVPGAGTFAAVFYAYGEIMLHQKKAWNGPVYSEGNNHFPYCGLTDGNYAQDQRYNPRVNPWLVDFDLRKMHDLCCNFGMGNIGMFFGRRASLGDTREEVDDSIDRFLAATVAFGHPGFFVRSGGEHNSLRSYYMLQQLHSRYTLASAQDIRYVTADGKLLDPTTAVATGVFNRSQVAVKYSNGCVVVANGNTCERLTASVFGRKIDLPPNGYAGWTADGTVDVLSSDPNGQRCDYAVTPAYIYVDGRGSFTRFAKAASDGIGICRFLPENAYEVIPYKGSDPGFAIVASKAEALDADGKVIGAAKLRRSRGLTYVVPVKGALSYVLRGNQTENAPVLTATRDHVYPGEKVTVSGRKAHTVTIPADATPGTRTWHELDGAWIDFNVVPMTDLSMTLADQCTLRATLVSNLPAASDATVAALGTIRKLKLVPGAPASVDFTMPPATCESVQNISVTVNAEGTDQHVDGVLLAMADIVPIADLPDRYDTGICLRGQREITGFGETHATVAAQQIVCDEVGKRGLFMHPPWVGGVGYVFARYEPVTLPADPPAVFRAVVGKKDGCFLGDGILYKVVVATEDGVETTIAQTTVTEHKWVPIEGDLTYWAGTAIRVKLVTDVGLADDSSGDWGCWADMRIESRDKMLVRSLRDDSGAYRTEPGPSPVPGIDLATLRKAVKGSLRYDGIGLSGGTGKYGSSAILNGIELGPMAPAPGKEGQGIWSEGLVVPLTADAIASLGFRNRFQLKNPGGDCFKVRRFWLDLVLSDGRTCSSDVSAAAFSQPGSWAHAEGIGVPRDETLTVDIWFRP